MIKMCKIIKWFKKNENWFKILSLIASFSMLVVTIYGLSIVKEISLKLDLKEIRTEKVMIINEAGNVTGCITNNGTHFMMIGGPCP